MHFTYKMMEFNCVYIYLYTGWMRRRSAERALYSSSSSRELNCFFLDSSFPSSNVQHNCSPPPLLLPSSKYIVYTHAVPVDLCIHPSLSLDAAATIFNDLSIYLFICYYNSHIYLLLLLVIVIFDRL